MCSQRGEDGCALIKEAGRRRRLPGEAGKSNLHAQAAVHAGRVQHGKVRRWHTAESSMWWQLTGHRATAVHVVVGHKMASTPMRTVWLALLGAALVVAASAVRAVSGQTPYPIRAPAHQDASSAPLPSAALHPPVVLGDRRRDWLLVRPLQARAHERVRKGRGRVS